MNKTKIGTLKDLEPHNHFSKWVYDHDILVFKRNEKIKMFKKGFKKKISITVFTPNLSCKRTKIFKSFCSGYHSSRQFFFVFSQKSFLTIKKKFSLKIKYISDYYDPFTKLISVKNKIKYLLYKRKYLDIFFKFSMVC